MLFDLARDVAAKLDDGDSGIALILGLRLWAVTGISTCAERVLGDVVGETAPGAFDRFRLTAIRFCPHRLGGERNEDALPQICRSYVRD